MQEVLSALLIVCVGCIEEDAGTLSAAWKAYHDIGSGDAETYPGFSRIW